MSTARSRGRTKATSSPEPGREVAPGARPGDPQHGQGAGRVLLPQGGKERALGRCRPGPRRAARCRRCGRSAGQSRHRPAWPAGAPGGCPRRRGRGRSPATWAGPGRQPLDQGRQGLAGPHGRGAQDQVGARAVLHDMVGNGLGRLLAAAIERPFMVVQPGIAPGRFRMSQEENCLHGPIPKNPLKTVV